MPEVRDSTASLRQVAKTPRGIGYATASEVKLQSDIRPLSLSKRSHQAFVSLFADTKATAVNKAAFTNVVFHACRAEVSRTTGSQFINIFLLFPISKSL